MGITGITGISGITGITRFSEIQNFAVYQATSVENASLIF